MSNSSRRHPSHIAIYLPVFGSSPPSRPSRFANMPSAPPHPQALPSIVVTDGEHVPAPLGRLVDELDVLFVVVDILQDIQAFGTVANLAAVDRLFKARLQPWMEKTKKRIVMDLDDLALRDTSNFKNIQCVQFLSSPSFRETLRLGKADDSTN